MLRNYLKMALRNLWKNKGFSAINILGLTIGMASSLLILLWVRNELSYDRFHAHADHIYRITVDASGFKAAVNPAGMPAGLQAAMPEVGNVLRLAHERSILFAVGTREFEEPDVFFADSNFLQFFGYRLLAGDPKTALRRPDAVLLTEAMARKYFGSDGAIGKTLKMNNDLLLTVTGILAEVPENSHLRFDFILPMAVEARDNDDLKKNVWTNFNFYGYVRLDDHFPTSPANLARLEKRMDAIYQEHVPPTMLKAVFHLQPLTDIHLHSGELQVDLPGHGNLQYVNIFLIVAVFILIVACINFMNLATARSARRAKEVGLRKVVGALRGQLIAQFIGESMLIAFLSLVLAIGIVALVLPAFDHLAGKALSLRLSDGSLWLMLLGIAAATGLLAGSYPALYLSGFRPVAVLKGTLTALGGNLAFRNGLVIVQFVVSIVLLIGTFIVYSQLRFIRDRNPGFTKANLIYMPMKGELWGKMSALKAELQRHSATSDYCLVSELPINLKSGASQVFWDGKDPRSQIIIPAIDVTEGFIDVFQMKILAGRGFSTAFGNDTGHLVINEKMMRTMGLTLSTAIGKPLQYGDIKGSVIGVVQDFNFKPIQQPIEPLVLYMNEYKSNVVVRAKPGQTAAAVHALAEISKELNPAYPFSYNFLDQDLANLYKGEQQMSVLFNLFAILALVISGLGLYGLSAYLAQRRTKEIGVRKVLGASVFSILYLLSTGFTRLVLVAVVIAVPLSVWAINRWLEGFAYHVTVSWLIFPLAAVVALVFAWVTVSFESLRAAVMNPARSLKIE
jgi:ABC-type antimicrobial peptide transport system permease subunit